MTSLISSTAMPQVYVDPTPTYNDGGGNLAVKLKDPKARASFAARHDCENKKDKTKAGYWACRLPRYAKSLGLSGGGTWW